MTEITEIDSILTDCPHCLNELHLKDVSASSKETFIIKHCYTCATDWKFTLKIEEI